MPSVAVGIGSGDAPWIDKRLFERRIVTELLPLKSGVRTCDMMLDGAPDMDIFEADLLY